MKNSIILAAAMLFSVVGFSQTSESADSKSSKPACCAKGKSAKSCSKEAKANCAPGTAKAEGSGTSDQATINATEPRREKATSKETSEL